MKVKLLNDGFYRDLRNIKFPKIVEALQLNGTTRVFVKSSELGIDSDETFMFIDGEYEVIDEI